MAPMLQGLHMLRIIPKAKNFNISSRQYEVILLMHMATSQFHIAQITSDSNTKCFNKLHSYFLSFLQQKTY